MSLPNPGTVVTEERLAEFYQMILPYLGGLPSVLNNKFAKGDLYSNDEKLIGQWVDGKPLYQKTIDAGALPNKTIKKFAHGIANVDNIWVYDGYALNSNDRYPVQFPSTYGTSYCWNMYANKTNIEIDTQQNRSGTTAIVTVRYTKTTDSAISIGDANDYSTTEKLIGTWIDGKPLYQKTIDFGALPNAYVKNVAHNIANVDKIWVSAGYALGSNGNTYNVTFASAAAVANNFNAYANSTYVGIETGSNRTAWSAIITVQYTKTTDNASS